MQRFLEYAGYKPQAQMLIQFMLGISFQHDLDASSPRGDICRSIVCFLFFFGLLSLAGTREHTSSSTSWNEVTRVVFRIVALLMRFAPWGRLGAMAFTIGKYGLGFLWEPLVS